MVDPASERGETVVEALPERIISVDEGQWSRPGERELQAYFSRVRLGWIETSELPLLIFRARRWYRQRLQDVVRKPVDPGQDVVKLAVYDSKRKDGRMLQQQALLVLGKVSLDKGKLSRVGEYLIAWSESRQPLVGLDGLDVDQVEELLRQVR